MGLFSFGSDATIGLLAKEKLKRQSDPARAAESIQETNVSNLGIRRPESRHLEPSEIANTQNMSEGPA